MDKHQRGPAGDFDDVSGFGLCSFAEFEYRPETDSYEARYDEQTVRPSIAVIGAMSLLLDEAPEDLVSLGESVDLEALDALLAPGATRVGTDSSVSFRYYEREITVATGGTITIGEPAAEGADVGADGRVGSTTG